MTTLGQRLKASSEAFNKKMCYTPEQVEAREARRVETLRKSLMRVLEKAKTDIRKAIDAGKPAHEVCSRVPEREACYRLLKERFGWLKYDPRAEPVLRPLWEAFVLWTLSEQLEVSLQPYTCGEGLLARQYVRIRVQPESVH